MGRSVFFGVGAPSIDIKNNPGKKWWPHHYWAQTIEVLNTLYLQRVFITFMAQTQRLDVLKLALNDTGYFAFSQLPD